MSSFANILFYLACGFFFCIGTVNSLAAESYPMNGVYQYNKGLNKANATLYVLQYKNDSAFFYLNAISGLPDFNTTELKGFLRIDSGKGYYLQKDSCLLSFSLANNMMTVKEDSFCHFEASTSGKYKRSSPIMKKNSTFLLSYTEKTAVLKIDSALCYEAPTFSAKVIYTLPKNAEFKIIDEYQRFFLIELKEKASVFLWITKSSLKADTKK